MPIVYSLDLFSRADSAARLRQSLGIGRGGKLDDLVLAGHASQVGANTLRCGQVDTAGHLSVGDGTVITAQSGVPNDVPPHALYSGYPAVENREWLKMMAALNHLPELHKRVRELEAQLERLHHR